MRLWITSIGIHSRSGSGCNRPERPEKVVPGALGGRIYRPGWRGGRRESGVPRLNCCLKPLNFTAGLGAFPTDGWLFLDITLLFLRYTTLGRDRRTTAEQLRWMPGLAAGGWRGIKKP